MMQRHYILFITSLIALQFLNGNVNGFAIPNSNYAPLTKLSMAAASAADPNSSQKATLDENTTWRLRFALNGVPTTNGRTVGELFNVDVQFILEEGFEPPQGIVKQIPKETPKKDDDETNEEQQESNVRYLKVTSGRWKLSEDPNDRKDGLWVWGLFKEPLYPFLLLQLETEEYKLPGKEENAIVPLTLYAQINHKRDKSTGEVELDAATLNLREIETINADPFGASKVRIGMHCVLPVMYGLRLS